MENINERIERAILKIEKLCDRNQPITASILTAVLTAMKEVETTKAHDPYCCCVDCAKARAFSPKNIVISQYNKEKNELAQLKTLRGDL